MALFRSTFQRTWVLFAVVFLSAAISKAAIIPNTNRDTFANLLAPGYYHSDFTAPFAAGDQFSTTTLNLAGTGNVQPGAAFDFTIATPDVGPVFGNTLFVLTPSGNYPRGQAMSTAITGKDLVLNFTSGNVTAVGASFSLTDSGENRASGTFDITLNFNTGAPQTFLNIGTTTSPDDGVPFRGFRTDGTVFITSLTFHPDNDFATLDDLHVGAVPEPAATGIAAALLCLLVAGRGILMRVWSKLRSQVA